MLKKTKTEKPKVKEPLNPYIEGKKAWNDRLGGAVAYGRAGLMFGMMSLLISIPAVFYGMNQAGKSKVVPYVIEVDSLGNVRGAGVAARTAFNQDYIIEAALSDFIQNFRGVTVDGQLQKARIDKLYQYLGGKSIAQQKANTYFQSGNDPFVIAQTKTVSVRVVSVNAVANTSSYNIEWMEVDYNRTGMQTEERRYQAILTYKIVQPTSESVIRVNPLGIYVIDFDISEIQK